MSKKNRKTRKEKENSQSVKAVEKAKQVKAETAERKAKQEQEQIAQNIELVQNGLHVKILNVLLYIYLFLILVGTPLYVHDAFNDIGTSKWNWYARVTFGYTQYPFIVIVPGAQILA